MGVLSLYAGKLSLWRVSTLCAGVGRQYSLSACGDSSISFPLYDQRVRNCTDRAWLGALWRVLSWNIPRTSPDTRLTRHMIRVSLYLLFAAAIATFCYAD